MEKLELKSGDVVELREEKGKYILLLGTEKGDVLFCPETGMWDTLDTLTDDFKNDAGYEELDFMKISRPNTFHKLTKFRSTALNVIWTRDEPKKMTVSQIQYELGYKIEIID